MNTYCLACDGHVAEGGAYIARMHLCVCACVSAAGLCVTIGHCCDGHLANGRGVV